MLLAPNIKTYGTIHIIGIGGIGMSGIAEILHHNGCNVQGSDMSENANVERLKELGVKVFVGHHAENIKNASVIVKSTAVKDSNPEVAEAIKLGIKVIHRAEILAEIMKLRSCISIAGTHGKTTTTTMMAALFDKAEADASVLNGGVINAYGSNARWSNGDWLVVEADESDGTFVRVPSTVGVITNIDPEHLEHYGSFEALRKAFRNFVTNLPYYGFAVLCADHVETAELAESISSRKILTYGIKSDKADIVASNLQTHVDGTSFDVTFSANVTGGVRVLKNVKVAIPGYHNVLNALSVLAVGAQLGFSDEILQTGLANFQGVQRRFTKVGDINGIQIIDDYAHHPVEINATLSAAQNVAQSTGGKVIAVVQPHRYTRLNALFNDFASCFAHADKVLVAQVYAAGEEPIQGADSTHLVNAINKNGCSEASLLEYQGDLARQIVDIATHGDVVICLGAGNITYWARSLESEISELSKKVVSSS